MKKLPEIEWIICGLLYVEDETSFHFAEGASGDGRAWVGVAVMVDGSLEEIIDIENP